MSTYITHNDSSLSFVNISTLNAQLNKLNHTSSDQRKLNRIIINLSTILTHEQFDTENRIRGIEMIAQRKTRIINSDTKQEVVNVTYCTWFIFSVYAFVMVLLMILCYIRCN